MEALEKGIFPFWNPYSNCGEPFFLTLYAYPIFFNPLNLVLYAAVAIFKFSLLDAYVLSWLCIFIEFAAGCFFLFRYLFKERLGAYTAFFTAVFSSISVIYFRQPAFLWVYSTPWILWLTLAYLEKKEKRYLIFLSYALGFTFTGIYSVYFLYFYVVFLVSAIMTVKGFWKKIISVLAGRYKARNLIFATVILSLTLQVGAVFSYKDRIIPVIRMEVAMRSEASREKLQNFFYVYKFKRYRVNENIFYAGILGVVLAFIGFFYGEGKFKRPFFITGTVMAIIMLGSKTPLMRLSHDLFPGFALIRHSAFFAPFFMLVLAYFAGLGMETIYDRAKDKNFINKIQMVFIELILMYAAVLLLQPLFDIVLTRNTLKSCLYAMMALLFGILFLEQLKRPGYKALKVSVFLLLLLCDLIYVDKTALDSGMLTERQKIAVPESPQPYVYSDYRLRRQEPIFDDLNLLLPDLFHEFAAFPYKHELGTHFFELKDYYDFRNAGIPDVSAEIITAMTSPKLRFIEWPVKINRKETLAYLKSAKPGNLEETAVVEEEPPSFPSVRVAGKEALIDVTAFDPNRLTAEVKAGKPSLLYYGDGYDGYWRAYVDKKPAKVYRTNYAFKSVFLDKGEHIVEFVYDPRFYKFALMVYAISAMSFFIYLGWCLYDKIRARGRFNP